MDLTAYVTPSLLWSRHAAAYAHSRAREEVARSDAFYDDVMPLVAGEYIRVMTPADVLSLERLKNPLVTGGQLADITAAHIRQFLWLLSADNSSGFLSEFRFARFMRRTGRAGHLVCDDLRAACAECVEYLDTVLQDAPGAGSKPQADQLTEAEGCRRPIGANFLAVILVPLAAEIGPTDPYDGRPWQFSPLPRIFQYLKVASARASGERRTDDSPHREIEAAWLREVNAARSAGVLVGEGSIPGSPELDGITAESVAAAHAAC